MFISYKPSCMTKIEAREGNSAREDCSRPGLTRLGDLVGGVGPKNTASQSKCSASTLFHSHTHPLKRLTFLFSFCFWSSEFSRHQHMILVLRSLSFAMKFPITLLPTPSNNMQAEKMSEIIRFWLIQFSGDYCHLVLVCATDIPNFFNQPAQPDNYLSQITSRALSTLIITFSTQMSDGYFLVVFSKFWSCQARTRTQEGQERLYLQIDHLNIVNLVLVPVLTNFC